jgi:hypothetical protein
MAPTTVGIYQIANTCERCHLDGFATRKSYTIRYALDLSGVPDLSRSYEYFGRSVLRKPFEKSHFAHPLLVVRGLTLERLLGAGAKDLTAEPLEVTNVGSQLASASG